MRKLHDNYLRRYSTLIKGRIVFRFQTDHQNYRKACVDSKGKIMKSSFCSLWLIPLKHNQKFLVPHLILQIWKFLSNL